MDEKYRILPIAFFLFSVALVSAGVFLLVKDPVKHFAFSGELMKTGDWWRLLTFPFVHVSGMHLLQNLLAVGIAFLLAFEIVLVYQNAMLSFFAASFGVALLDLVAFPWVLIAGISVGVYALFGLLATQGSSFAPRQITLVAFAIPVFAQVVFSLWTENSWITGAVLHAVGFLMGITLYFFLAYERTKLRVFEVAINEV